jgi:hypothetical protein
MYMNFSKPRGHAPKAAANINRFFCLYNT